MQKSVLITGVNRGLGKELFNCFARNNYFVYGLLRNEMEAQKLAQKYPKNSTIILADVSSDESIPRIQAAVQDHPIDLLINNAGIAGTSSIIQQTDSAELINLFNIHCLGVFRTTKALANNLVKAKKPMIININSRFGSITRQSQKVYEGLEISYAYRIAKAAQNMLTNCIRLEFKDSIEVISLHPGKMKTKIASKDADLDPIEVARKIFKFYDEGILKETNGIIELEKEVIEW